MSDVLKPTLKEIAALMCGIAVDNSWKRGRRNFMVTSKNIFGIQLQVRHKNGAVALTSPSWRIAFTILNRAAYLPASEAQIVKLPVLGYPQKGDTTPRPPSRFNRNVRTAPKSEKTHERLVSGLVFEISDTAMFERDWVLLRMFSSEWAEYAT